MATDEERKERVLHTRVPESLERHLKSRARRLGMSVSTVVRHVLLNTFGLVEDIVNDSADVALALAGSSPEPAPPRPSAEILAWQDVVLNLNAVCERCNAVLRKGARAALGVRDGLGPRVVICSECLARVPAEPTRLPVGRRRR